MSVGAILSRMDREGFFKDLTSEQQFDPRGNQGAAVQTEGTASAG